ncbi:N-acetylmuramic acid 6-phosphate etherase [Chromatiaceae bacterium AAb-1]|nr:N-acetylmuramic acid 6-phosphate etherase [Chromatiaceae bacterium AAb-1]
MDKQTQLLNELESFISEGRNPETMDIDTLPVLGLLQKINSEDQKVALAVREVLPQIATAVEFIVSAFEEGGRLIYLGAGTSGRLGILDAVECPPTFSVADDMVIGLIAGGEGAIRKAVEGAEDDPELAEADLKALHFTQHDVLVGIAASGRTPYVVGGLQYARAVGARTVAVACNPGSAITQYADVAICPVVGPEVLTGSTRMKSGTAQKMVLNMLSTASMIRIGKAYQNLMVDVQASNEKLYARAVRIVMQATGCEAKQASETLQQTGYKTKLAILHILTGLKLADSQKLLEQNKGQLRRAVREVSGS